MRAADTPQVTAPSPLRPTGGEVVRIAQLASLAGPPSRVAQTETPVTLQFQGNKFTLSHSQLRQLTAGQPLQLQGRRSCPVPHGVGPLHLAGGVAGG